MSVPSSLRGMHTAHKDMITKGNLFTADISLIKEQPGFNARGDYSDASTQAHIRKLANAYKRGDQMPPLEVVVVDGEILLRDGHCRFHAIHLANSEGAQIQRHPLMQVEGDEIDQVKRIVTSQDGLKLPPLGLANVYARMINLGLAPAEIAEQLQRSITHVKDYLEINNLPVGVKKLIASETIGALEALKQYREHGTAAISIIEECERELNKGQEQVNAPSQQAPAGQATDSATESESSSVQGEAGDSETGASAEAGQVTRKKVKVTRKAIEAKLGYRSSLKGTVVHRIGKTIDSLVDRLPKEAAEGDKVSVELSWEEINELRDLQKSVKPKQAKGEETADSNEQGAAESSQEPSQVVDEQKEVA